MTRKKFRLINHPINLDLDRCSLGLFRRIERVLEKYDIYLVIMGEYVRCCDLFVSIAGKCCFGMQQVGKEWPNRFSRGSRNICWERMFGNYIRGWFTFSFNNFCLLFRYFFRKFILLFLNTRLWFEIHKGTLFLLNALLKIFRFDLFIEDKGKKGVYTRWIETKQQSMLAQSTSLSSSLSNEAMYIIPSQRFINFSRFARFLLPPIRAIIIHFHDASRYLHDTITICARI